MLVNFLKLVMQFISENIIFESLVSSFFTVVGGTAPIAILIYFFSKEEKKKLMAHATDLEKTLPFLEQLLKKMLEVIEKSISPENIDPFKQYFEAQNMIEEHKKFIKYAKNYNFISAIGHVLRMSNYVPRSISEHKEISKNLPNSLSSNT